MPEFVYDFKGLDPQAIVIIREQVRKKLASLVPSHKAIPEFEELDRDLGEFFYQEEKRLEKYYGMDLPLNKG